jgi:hypothetical protein
MQNYFADPESLPEFAVAYNKKNEKVKPIGFSINEAVFGEFAKNDTAAQRGWITYMNLGEPLIEERDNIKQPAPDTLSSRVYVNRATTPCKFEDTVEFTIENTISWSIEGTVQLTFGAQAAASLQTMIQTENTLHKQTTMHSHPNDTGSEEENATDQASTVQGTATGTAELSAQLMLGITASASGSLTTSWASKSTISGDVDGHARVTTRATQRRVKRKYVYQLPVTFAGYFAAHYPEPVQIKDANVQPNVSNGYAEVIALCITDDNQLVPIGKPFRSIILEGTADDESTLVVEHTVFEKESLEDMVQPLHKKPA